MMTMGADAPIRPLAVVTGASTGIGLELARRCAEDGFNLIVASNDGRIEEAAAGFRALGAEVETLDADLSVDDGLSRLIELVGDRPVHALLANAGIGLAGAFLDQRLADARKVVETNVLGTISLVHEIGGRMRDRGAGRILVTGSIGGYVPGSYHAVYNATKAFLNSFSAALRDELKDAGVSVTCLMPGPTETEIFDRSGFQGARVETMRKDDPAEVAAAGYDAMMRGAGEIVPGWKNKLVVAASGVVPDSLLAAGHRKGAKRPQDGDD